MVRGAWGLGVAVLVGGLDEMVDELVTTEQTTHWKGQAQPPHVCPPPLGTTALQPRTGPSRAARSQREHSASRYEGLPSQGIASKSELLHYESVRAVH